MGWRKAGAALISSLVSSQPWQDLGFLRRPTRALRSRALQRASSHTHCLTHRVQIVHGWAGVLCMPVTPPSCIISHGQACAIGRGGRPLRAVSAVLVRCRGAARPKAGLGHLGLASGRRGPAVPPCDVRAPERLLPVSETRRFQGRRCGIKERAIWRAKRAECEGQFTCADGAALRRCSSQRRAP